MSADIIDFEERSGSIKNLAITRRLAEEFVGPVSNKIHNYNATIWPDISPLQCMAIDIVNEIFPSSDTAPAEYNYQAPADDPA